MDKTTDPDVHMNVAMPRSLRQWLSARAREFTMTPTNYVRWLLLEDRKRQAAHARMYGPTEEEAPDGQR